ncbi:MAG: helix-turn-helix transcriptional regulator [Oscillospiraceae bacterium]|nr:helix-turn-helix transcriptional regulator [Oscillospiraceae bacterium]
MQDKRTRFGDFIKKKRLSDPRELTQSDVAKELGFSVGLYGDIENRRRRPFDPEKMEKFARFLNLTEDEKARMYDLASHENREIPADIEDILMYEEVGELARFALRQSKAGNATEEDWKQFIRKIEKNKERREGGAKNDNDENKQD